MVAQAFIVSEIYVFIPRDGQIDRQTYRWTNGRRTDEHGNIYLGIDADSANI